MLRRKAAPVKKFRPDLRALVADMFETMADANGIGLAAPQIGVSKRLIVVDVPGEEGVHDRFALINPRLIRCIGGKESREEGCLSMPGVTAEVSRPNGVMMAGLDEEGNEVEITAHGLLARCLLHEMDHLDGVLFIDHVGISESEARRLMDEFQEDRKG